MILTELWGRLDCITIQTDKDTQIFKIQNSQSSVCFRDITLEWQAGKIFLSAFESAVRKIEFHFMQTFPKEAEVLGDAWERSYGDLRFVKICECQGKIYLKYKRTRLKKRRVHRYSTLNVKGPCLLHTRITYAPDADT